MMQIALVYHRGNAQNIWLIIRNEKLAKNLLEKKKQAEEFAASRTRFLASASHDLRQPVQALNFFLSALQPQIKTEKGKEILNCIQTGKFSSLLDYEMRCNYPVTKKFDDYLERSSMQYTYYQVQSEFNISM